MKIRVGQRIIRVGEEVKRESVADVTYGRVEGRWTDEPGKVRAALRCDDVSVSGRQLHRRNEYESPRRRADRPVARHEGVSDKIAGADVPQADLLGLVEPVWADEDAEAVHTDV